VGECPAGSVLALIELKYVCLRQGQACKSTPAWQSLYRAYAFRCKRGRLTRLPKSKGFTTIVDIGGYRLAMFCSGTVAPTVVMESGFGWGVRPFRVSRPRLDKQRASACTTGPGSV
jgi:hypothetical protein